MWARVRLPLLAIGVALMAVLSVAQSIQARHLAIELTLHRSSTPLCYRTDEPYDRRGAILRDREESDTWPKPDAPPPLTM